MKDQFFCVKHFCSALNKTITRSAVIGEAEFVGILLDSEGRASKGDPCSHCGVMLPGLLRSAPEEQIDSGEPSLGDMDV